MCKVKPDFSNVIKLSSETEAVLLPNGDSMVLPSDFRQRLQARKKKYMKWAEEDPGIPEKSPFTSKLNIAHVKFGPTLGKTKLCLQNLTKNDIE